MERNELLTKLAMELAEWPQDLPGPNLPGLWSCHHAWRCHAIGDMEPIFEHDWLQRRAELINKPSWDDAPEWAEWLAQDFDNYGGRWNWFPGPSPECREVLGGWWNNAKHVSAATAGNGAIPAGHDWRFTLERRPECASVPEQDVKIRFSIEVPDEAALAPDPMESAGEDSAGHIQGLGHEVVDYPMTNDQLREAINDTVRNLELSKQPAARFPPGDDVSDMLKDHLNTLLYIQRCRAAAVTILEEIPDA